MRSKSSKSARQKLGSAALMAVFLSFSIVFSSCKKDDEPTSLVEIQSPSDVIIGVNNELQLSVTVDGAAPTGGISWTSSNGLVAEVDDNGLVTSKKHGVAIISATDGISTGEFTLQVFNVSGSSVASFDEDVVDFMRQFTVFGASYAVVKNGKLVMARGYGVADTVTLEVVTPTSLFRIADVSKPITATAIMKLVDDGLLDLNERMFTILQDKLPQVNLPDARLIDITVGQLLNHSSGTNLIPQPMFNQGQIAVALQVASPPTLDQILEWWAMRNLSTTPGEAFAYHNMNYVLLGRIIEAKTGMSYEAYVKDNILTPLDIDLARIGGSFQADKFPREVSYYAPFSNNVLSAFDTGPAFVPLPYGGIGSIANMDAMGGWIASAVDLARFAVATDGDPSTPDIISLASQQLMVTDAGDGFGSGWFVEADNWNHSGLMPGTMSTLYVHDDGTIVIGMLNCTHDFAGPFLQPMFNAFTEQLRSMALATTWPDQDLFDDF